MMYPQTMAFVRRALSLYTVIALTAFCQSSRSKANDEKAVDAIRQLLAKYTAALDAADVGLAAQVWRTSPDVSLIHPGGHARGWEEVKQFYNFFGSAFSDRKLTARDVSVQINGETAWVLYYWHFIGKGKDGSTLETDGRESQIYYKTGNRWQLIHAHYSSPVKMP